MPDDLDNSVIAHPAAHRMQAATNNPATPAKSGPFSATYPADAGGTFDDIAYGPDIAGESELRLLGDFEGRRVLVLGCGAGHAPVAMALQGAKVIAADPSADRIARTREAAEAHEVKIELHQSDLAELAFVRADSVDLVFSAYGLATEPDLDRVFRQAHRVLKPELYLVFSLPHPAFALIDPASNDPMRIRRTYWDGAPRPFEVDGQPAADYPRTVSAVFTGLSRSNFKVDTLLELEPGGEKHSPYYSEPMRWVPATLIMRGKKEGI
jgi:SAM-dependent methyltransferase